VAFISDYGWQPLQLDSMEVEVIAAKPWPGAANKRPDLPMP
jgi:hypothetical protein